MVIRKFSTKPNANDNKGRIRIQFIAVLAIKVAFELFFSVCRTVLKFNQNVSATRYFMNYLSPNIRSLSEKFSRLDGAQYTVRSSLIRFH